MIREGPVSSPRSLMIAPALPRAAAVFLLAALSLVNNACQSRPAVQRGAYRVTWRAVRVQNNVPLATVTSPVFGVGGSVDVRTDSLRPSDDRPALPRFTASLSPDAMRAGTLELVTRAFVREVIRTKKGKRKVTRRVIGGLLPIRSGETQEFSGPGDPIHLDVHLEGGGVQTTK